MKNTTGPGASAPSDAKLEADAGASPDVGVAADAGVGAAAAPGATPATDVTIYTDGACRGNPGPGGWGALLVHHGREKELWGGEPQTTNNRMELMAAIRALEALTRRCRVALYTDSQYVRNGIREWLPNWKRRGWKTADKKPVKNQDLWERLDALTAGHEIEWHWVRGHSGHDGNERADQLANRGIDERR